MGTRLKLGMILISIEVISHFILESMPRENLELSFLGIGMLIPPSIYYLVAGCFSFVSIKLMANSGDDQLVADMTFLALFMLVGQILGLAVYHSKSPIEIYDYLIIVILTLQILRLLLRREGDGVDRDSNIVFFARSLTMQRNRHIC
jgi:hypothetical protein